MPASDSPETHCRICGAKLDPSILGGSCPACIWSDLIFEEQEANATAGDTPDIEGYDVLEEIGDGGMGVVYRAYQHQPEREVALKIIAPYSLRAAQARARFMIEVEAMAAVEHPALLPLYDAGEDKHGRPWLAMQIAHGGTLATRLESYAGKWKEIARLMITLCEAIHYAHERGILHRDLKPANILFDDENHPYVADFGLAKWADGDSSVTHSSYLLGSPAYLAPEAAAGGSKVTTTVSDVYGLGAILYELLCGKKPYEGNQAAEVLTQILNSTLVSPRAKLSKIPKDLEIIVMKAMANKPERRYHSAAAVAEDLSRWMEGKMILARPVSTLERTLIWIKRNPALSTLSLLLIVSVLTGTILLWKSNQELTVALDDAEDRVDFMTRELPPRLEPLGRLDLLDDVFVNVSEHYDLNHRSDSQSLSRHADFLRQWSQILRPRGKIKEAVARLEQAAIKAKAATSGDKPSVEACRSRLATGRRLGEALIEDHQIDRARTTLTEAMEFSEQSVRLYPEDLRLAQLTAELELELAILELRADNPSQALTHGNQSLMLWNKIMPEMMSNPDSPHNQPALITAAMTHNILSKIHKKLGDSETEEKFIKSYLLATETLMKTSSANLHFRHEYIIARQISLRHHLLNGSLSLENGMKKFKEVDKDLIFLLSQEPGNIRWLTDAATNSIRLHSIASRQQDDTSSRYWLNITSDRVSTLYKSEPNDIDFLSTQRSIGDHCATAFLSTDWEKAKYHFNQTAKIQVNICRLTNSADSHVSLQNGTRTIAIHYLNEEGEKQAVAWLLDRAKAYNADGKKHKPAFYWTWSEAACYSQILKFSNESPDSQNYAFKCISLLLDISKNAEAIPHYAEAVYKTSLIYLKLIPQGSNKKVEFLSRLLETMPSLREKENAAMDQKWLELIIRSSAEIPKAQRKAIIELAISEFFSNPDRENSLYQQLQQLR